MPDLKSGGSGFESQPGLLHTKVYSAFNPPGSVNEYQLWLGRQRQVWLIPIADERVSVQIKLQAKYSRLMLFNLGEMSCFNQI